MSALALLLLVQADDPAETLRALGERMKDVRALSTPFDQRRTTALLEQPIVSSGLMYYRRDPGRLVFHIREPRPTVIHMDREAYQVWRPQEKRLERIDFGEDALATRLFMVFNPQPERLKAAFEITREGAEIRLVPKDAETRKRMSLLALSVASDPPALKRIRYVEADGDEVQIDLRAIALDPEIPESVWSLEVPPDAKVFRTNARRDVTR